MRGLDMKRTIHLLAMLLMAVPVAARYHSVGSEKEFEKLINEYPYAVVCFAPSGAMDDEKLQSSEKRQIKDEYKTLTSRVKSASENRDYKQYLSRDVGFIVVDVASKRAREVDREYAIKQFPTCLLFQQGKALSMAQVVKPTSKSDIVTLLESKLGAKLDKMIQDRKEDEREEREERIARYAAYASYYPYGYYGWGYPYGGYGWGYPYAGWRVGFGW